MRHIPRCCQSQKLTSRELPTSLADTRAKGSWRRRNVCEHWTVLFYSRWVAAVLSSLPSDTDLCSTVCCAAHNMAPHCIISYRMLQSLRMEPPGGLGLRGWTSRAPHWNWNCALHWQVGNYVKIYWCPLVGSLAYAIQEHCQSAELLSNDSSHMCSLTVLYATCT